MLRRRLTWWLGLAIHRRNDMTEAESAVLPAIASCLALGFSAWYLFTRIPCHGRVIHVNGSWQGLHRGDYSAESAASLYSARVSYVCPISNQKKVYVGTRSTGSHSWCRHGDPYTLCIDPTRPNDPTGTAWPISLTILSGVALLVSSIAFVSAVFGVSGGP